MNFSELVRKYNVPGPRYTSYPTVPYWESQPSTKQWIEHIGASLVEKEAVAAIYIHIPFCESLCTYCGCNTRITRNHSVANPYIDAILKEIALYLTALGVPKLRVAELHLGGGTPTFLSPEELARLFDGLKRPLDFSPEFESSIEVDPRVTTKQHLEVLFKYGFRRISMGVQDFDPTVQEAVHRVQSVEQVQKLTEQARTMGFKSINYDLIYGLPFQTKDSIHHTIQAVIRLRPDRIAFYAYAHVPWIKASQRRFVEADLPSGDLKRELYEAGRRLFEVAGYHEVGMDHFALPTDSLWEATESGRLHRNFMGYISRRVFPLIGLGVSSIGDSGLSFAQNEKLLEKYLERVGQGQIPIHRGHVLTAEDLVLRRHILNLMTRFQTEWTTKQSFTPFLDSLPSRLSEFEKDGLVEVRPGGCAITQAGRPFMRNICMAFDARLIKKMPETQLFSKTI